MRPARPTALETDRRQSRIIRLEVENRRLKRAKAVYKASYDQKHRNDGVKAVHSC